MWRQAPSTAVSGVCTGGARGLDLQASAMRLDLQRDLLLCFAAKSTLTAPVSPHLGSLSGSHPSALGHHPGALSTHTAPIMLASHSAPCYGPREVRGQGRRRAPEERGAGEGRPGGDTGTLTGTHS